MNFLCKFICFCFLIFLMPAATHCQQLYDKSDCSSESQVAESSYFCSSSSTNSSCDTYIIYRAQNDFQSLSNISSLFHLSLNKLLQINQMTEAVSTSIIPLGREIIIPVNCSCSGQFSQAIVMYNFSSSDPSAAAAVACAVFQGLVKAQGIINENPNNFQGGNVIKVPIRCACPSENDRSNGVKCLVTYPVIQNDHTDLIARKFGVLEESIWKANGLQSFESIFPNTTLLVPTTNDVPFMNWHIRTGSDDSALRPGGTIPTREVTSGAATTFLEPKVFSALAVLVAVVVLLILACCVCMYLRRKNHPQRIQPLSPTPSVSSNLSPDFLDGVSKLLKHSLMNFSLEELKLATEGFSGTSVIGTALYRGKIGSSYVAIEQMNSEEEARHVISILTKINHLNVVRLEGCCYGRSSTPPYLVLEYAENGSLRDCLSNAKMSRQLTWDKRMQIAFDLAVAIHYIHCYTKPAYVHRDINSGNVFINMNWRAKISGFRLAKPVTFFNEEKKQISWDESVVVGGKGYLAPEYLTEGVASLKVDVFAYGVVLLELLSAKAVVTTEGKLLKDTVNFLDDEAGFERSSGCMENLKEFLDPALEEDYPLVDAKCLTILAKACIVENPNHRPSMSDVLKALSRFF